VSSGSRGFFTNRTIGFIGDENVKTAERQFTLREPTAVRWPGLERSACKHRADDSRRPDRDEIRPVDPSGPGPILTVNGGSSSLKLALFADETLDRRASGAVERIDLPGTELVVRRPGAPEQRRPVSVRDPAQAATGILDSWGHLEFRFGLSGIGHRIVQGGPRLLAHVRVTDALLDELRENQRLDPEHLPGELALIELMARRFPEVPQVACFDSAFHRDLPQVARLLPIPRRYLEAGMRRLGFHGLSYTFLLEELRRVAGEEAAAGRVILAHLGSGSSLAAVRGGHPVDTTMGFTPAGGLVMGTRPGDLDPGLLLYLMRRDATTPEDMEQSINTGFGLRGVSGTTSDMRSLLDLRETDPRAADAVDLFVYQARKWVGALAAALGGFDTLVFSGGIGERSAEIRGEICAGLRYLGLRLDDGLNAAHAPVVSTADSAVTVRVIRTDEEIVIARSVRKILEEP
jgi:acetate kinase